MIITTVVLSGNRTGGSMRSRSWVGLFTGAALAAVLTTFTTAPARATVAIFPATPIGTATDTLTLNGAYTSLPTPLAQPFAASNFTLTLILPAEVMAPPLAPFPGFSLNLSGSYSNAGQTETFTDQSATFRAGCPGCTGAQSSGFEVQVFGLLTPGDFFVITPSTPAPLFSGGSTTATAPAYFSAITLSQSFAVDGLANYAPIDPNFTGTLTLTPNASVPEPATAALLLAPLGALAFLRRRRA
uniref:PEP-CTERM sorting domain-containing protein n=1 Tax=Acidicaldus sp. TaxID=1872105 RepID=A0A8J4HA31_9PROT